MFILVYWSELWVGGDRQNTDLQSMDYPNGLSKCTTPKIDIPNEYYLDYLKL